MIFRKFLKENMPVADLLAQELGLGEAQLNFTDEGFEGEKFFVDYIEVRHNSYECVKDDDGSLYAVDGEGGERVPRTAQEAADHRERPQPDREGDRRAGHQEERNARLDVREGQSRLRLDLQHAASRGFRAPRSPRRRDGFGRVGGPRGLRREGERVAVGAERRAAIAAGAVVGAGAAAVQTGADVHSGRSGRGAGSEPHAEHREDAEETLRTEPVYRGEPEGGHVHECECDLPNQIRGWSEHGDEDGGADSSG